MFSVYIKLAFESLKRQRTRSILTMLAMSIGIMAVIVIMSAGKGMESLILGRLDVFGADTFRIEPRVPQSRNTNGVSITTLKEKDLETIRKHRNVAAAGGEVTGQEIVSYSGEIKKVLLFGNSYATQEMQRFEMESGRFFTKDEEESLAQIAVLGSKVKNQLFSDSDPVGQVIYIKGKPFRVVGSVAPRGSAFFFDLDNIVIIPTKTMQKKILGVDYYAGISAKFKDIDQAEATIADLNSSLDENHAITDPKKRDFAIETVKDAVATLSTVADGITLLLIAGRGTGFKWGQEVGSVNSLRPISDLLIDMLKAYGINNPNTGNAISWDTVKVGYPYPITSEKSTPSGNSGILS
jgi:putative ABC transport system permease protein